MSAQTIKKIVIAGGGSAGWCTAAALSKLLSPLVEVTLVESDDIGIIGVGEATIPTIRTFHKLLGIDEREFLRATNGTVKMAIRFKNWAREGDDYFHSFGTIGKSTWMGDFHHVWLHAKAQGLAGELGEYCLEHEAAKAGKFYTNETSKLNYAYHFDSGLYGQFLRAFSEKNGVTRLEGKIEQVKQDAETGFITALVLESGEEVAGDLFIDCTGLKGLLIEQALKTGYDDWSHWIANDRAVAVQTESAGQLMPYTEASAHADGWRWRIPLQNRVGNGLVYASSTLSDDEATARLMGLLDAPTVNNPRIIRFQTGRRRKVWNKNCVAMGLSSGFIEPLESTNIHLFQIGVTRLIQMFPFSGITQSIVDRFNDATQAEVEKIRDFVILHYKLTERSDSAYWQSRRDLVIPDSLAHRIALFREQGHVYQAPDEVFRVDSWLQVMTGQRLEPQAWHHMGALLTTEQLTKALGGMQTQIAQIVAKMPSYAQFSAQMTGQVSTPERLDA